jgi:magnesium transporter
VRDLTIRSSYYTGDEMLQSQSVEPAPKMVCVTIPPPPFKVAKVSAEDSADLMAIVEQSSLAWLNYTIDDEEEVVQAALRFGFTEQLARDLVSQSYEAFEDNEFELGLVMPAIRIRGLEVDVNPVYVLVKDNLILTIHDRSVTRLVQFSRYADIWITKLPGVMPTSDKLTLMLARIMEVNNSRNFEELRKIEEKADDISEALLDPTIHYMETGRYIFDVKHCLILYLAALWRSLDLLNRLRHGDAELISDNPKALQRINNLALDLTKHISLTEHTSEVLISGTTVLQTLYNNQLLIINNRMVLIMTWMTVIGTAVLVPNTIATIMAYLATIPQEHLWWTSMLMVVSTVVATVVVYEGIMSKFRLYSTPEERSDTESMYLRLKKLWPSHLSSGAKI